jgi:hypothetical protein
MADIKQAAKWMQEGKAVRRPLLDSSISLAQKLGTAEFVWIQVLENSERARDKRCAAFHVDDLLADDWEIAH